MKNYAVSEQLVNAILSYLGSKPYVEVAQLINALSQIKEAPPAPLAVVPEPKES